MIQNKLKRPICLIIMDGWGISEKQKGNAIYQALTANIDYYMRYYPNTKLNAAGEKVGLPEGQMGNSEVGHTNIGAGRIVVQDYTKITNAIKDGSFYNNKVFKNAFQNTINNNSDLHFIGCLSDGGVHSHTEHLKALMKMAVKSKVKNFYIHPFLDGRDVFPKSAKKYIAEIQDLINELKTGEIASLSGRYYSLDRDNKWDRTKKSFDLLAYRKGEFFQDPFTAVEECYKRGLTDEFIEPCCIETSDNERARIKNGDSVIFFNFRPDRTRQLSSPFVVKDFNIFDRGEINPDSIYFAGMTIYDDSFTCPAAFPQERLKNTLGEIIADNNLKQLRIAETDKYPHVSFFFNGGIEIPFKNEDRIMIPTVPVKTYDLKPQMSAYEVTEKVIEKIYENMYDLIVLNYANADMVGHSGFMDSAITAVETVDTCVGLVVNALVNVSGIALITADHGNAEEMVCSITKNVITAHTSSYVPFILCDDSIKGLRQDYENLKLGDIAPTILELAGIEKPSDMTGNSLIKK